MIRTPYTHGKRIESIVLNAAHEQTSAPPAKPGARARIQNYIKLHKTQARALYSGALAGVAVAGIVGAMLVIQAWDAADARIAIAERERDQLAAIAKRYGSDHTRVVIEGRPHEIAKYTAAIARDVAAAPPAFYRGAGK